MRETALRLSYFTVGVGLAECAASLAAGTGAGSAALVGFGLDSLVESLSGAVMIWRFSGTAARENERVERRAAGLVGWTFLLLAVYVAVDSGMELIRNAQPNPSIGGLIIAAASSVVMPALYVRKRRVAALIGSGSLMADARQSLACAMLAVAVLAGLLLNATAGVWQADPIIGLLIALWLIREGVQTIRTRELCA